MKQRLFSCLRPSLLLTGFLLFGTSAWSALQPSSITVSDLDGQAVLVNAKTDTVRRLVIGDTLSTSDTIITDSDSEATLSFANGATVHLAANTHLCINLYIAEASGEALTSQTELALDRGSIVGDVAALTPDSSYNIYSPAGSAGIRGTTYLYDSGAPSSVQLGKGDLDQRKILNQSQAESSSTGWQPKTPPTFAIQKGSGTFTSGGKTTTVSAGNMFQVAVSPTGTTLGGRLMPISQGIAARISSIKAGHKGGAPGENGPAGRNAGPTEKKRSVDLGAGFFKNRHPNAVKKINAPSGPDAQKLVSIRQDFSNLNGRYLVVRFLPEEGNAGAFSIATFYATRDFHSPNRAAMHDSLNLRSQNLLTQAVDNSESIRAFLDQDFQVRGDPPHIVPGKTTPPPPVPVPQPIVSATP